MTWGPESKFQSGLNIEAARYLKYDGKMALSLMQDSSGIKLFMTIIKIHVKVDAGRGSIP